MPENQITDVNYDESEKIVTSLVRSMFCAICLFPIGLVPLIFSMLCVGAKSDGNVKKAKVYAWYARKSGEGLIVVVILLIAFILLFALWTSSSSATITIQ